MTTLLSDETMTSTLTDEGSKLTIILSDSLEIIESASSGGERTITVSTDQLLCDAMDEYNHTRFRRARILESVLREQQRVGKGTGGSMRWLPVAAATSMDFYKLVHTEGLLTFLLNAFQAWESLGPQGRDLKGSLPVEEVEHSTKAGGDDEPCPPLIPINMPLPRLPNSRQRPSKHVFGQMGYYCNDTCTPVFDHLVHELLEDAGVMQSVLDLALVERDTKSTIYAVPTHPGHHAAHDSFGGYCYVNHVAALAKQLQEKLSKMGTIGAKIAILDVDYHCGNGTASIFHDDSSVLLVSLHCDPDYDYPFHIGYADEVGEKGDSSRTLHLPLPPKTKWPAYRVALEHGLSRIVNDFDPQALIVSLGLDTYAEDPCALRLAGFELQGNDYVEMGRLIGERSASISTVIFVQEGGYRMDAVPEAAKNVVTSCHASRQLG
ncbi:hypothetical protein MPSEU_000439100 [Mayamaea pseudoterrestris]|nr:hypothetical protein MPSEU_000439100 [Mayamaea pseudoterrestris]